MIKSKKLLAVGIVAALGLAACGSDDDSGSESTDAATEGTEAPEATEAPAATDAPAEGTDAPATGDGATVGVVYDITGRGDRSFNDAAGAGLDQAVAELGVTGLESTPTGDGDRAERVQGLVDEGAGLVIGVGFLFGDSITAVAEANPDTSFAIIDSVVDLPNVASLVFAENEGSFLVGAAAALKSQTGTIGFIGGVENDLIKKFEAGYVAGARPSTPTSRCYELHQPAAGLLGLQRPGQGQGTGGRSVRGRRGHRLLGSGWLGSGGLRGRRRSRRSR